MCIYSDVTEQDLINLHKLAEKQKNQTAITNKKRILKQTNDKKLAEHLSPVTKRIEEVIESTKKLEDVIKTSNSEKENTQEIVPIEIDNIQTNKTSLPNSKKISSKMKETLGALMNSRCSLKIMQDDSDRASVLRIPIHTLGGGGLKINHNIYDLTPEVYQTLSSTSYTGKNMKDEIDLLKINNIINELKLYRYW